LGIGQQANKEDIALIEKWRTVTTDSFAKQLGNPALEKAMDIYFLKMPILALLQLLGPFHQKSAGYPVGGSLKFSQAIESRYLELGGKIRYNSRVANVLTQDDKACGLRPENGEEVKADKKQFGVQERKCSYLHDFINSVIQCNWDFSIFLF
jgi:phytoene dehydrogenase-like protein